MTPSMLGFNVPILNTNGRPFRAYGAFVMANVMCGCRPDNGPMLIRGVDVVVQCQFCRNKFGIVRASFDRSTGDTDPRIEIGLLARGGPDA